MPQATRASTTPSVGAAATSPAWGRLSPSWSRSEGIRNAGPWIVTAAAAWASVEAPSIAQRRVRPGLRWSTVTLTAPSETLGAPDPADVSSYGV